MSKNVSQLIWSTMDAGELALIKAIFDSHCIKYYINNENFAQTHGMAVPAEINVINAQVEEAKELIKDFIHS